MDWLTISLRLLDRVFEYWNDKRSKEYQEKKLKLLKDLLHEEEKHISTRDQSRIDRIQRELFILASVVERESSKISGPNSSN